MRGTSDHIFVLNSLIGNTRKRGGKLYAAFIDFRTAFDSVNRWILMGKLRERGLKGRMMNMIESIYRDTANEVIMREGISRRFRSCRGVRQGCLHR